MSSPRSRDDKAIHVPVLVGETADALDFKPGEIFLDATIGGGGHSEEAVFRTGGNLRVVGIDQDETALARSRARLAAINFQPTLVKANFRDLDGVLDEAGIKMIDKALFDLGVSSDELETSGRGFSFQRDEPLLMTYDDAPRGYAPTAATLVNTLGRDELADIIYKFGEERRSRRIASEITLARREKRIETSGELADIVARAVPAWSRFGRIHPATKTFQALRIAVNDELAALAEGLPKSFARLTVGGRLAVISFHSLEDRIVKNFFREKARTGEGRLLFKKPVRPTEEEKIRNTRARSAKLRAIEKIS